AARALELAPDSIAALRSVIGLDVAEKSFAHAKSLVDARLARSPKDPAVLLVAADLSRETGDQAGEESALRRTIDADSTSAEGFSRLAFLYMKQGTLDQ